MTEQVQEIRIGQLRGFKDHPFQVKDNEELQALCDSIREYGVLSPLLARPTEDGYEIISGHRRKAAALKLGLDKLPVLVWDICPPHQQRQAYFSIYLLTVHQSSLRNAMQDPAPYQ